MICACCFDPKKEPAEILLLRVFAGPPFVKACKTEVNGLNEQLARLKAHVRLGVLESLKVRGQPQRSFPSGMHV